jgi:hypothetical protein
MPVDFGQSVPKALRTTARVPSHLSNQVSHVPLYFYPAPNVPINEGNDKVGLSYLLFNFLGYLKTGNPNVMPYGAIGAGWDSFLRIPTSAAILQNLHGTQTGYKIQIRLRPWFKVQAQVMSVAGTGERFTSEAEAWVPESAHIVPSFNSHL